MLMIKLILTNLLRMLIGKKMIIWGLKLAASHTENKVDDNVILLAEAALENDVAKVKDAIEALSVEFKS